MNMILKQVTRAKVDGLPLSGVCIRGSLLLVVVVVVVDGGSGGEQLWPESLALALAAPVGRQRRYLYQPSWPLSALSSPGERPAAHAHTISLLPSPCCPYICMRTRNMSCSAFPATCYLYISELGQSQEERRITACACGTDNACYIVVIAGFYRPLLLTREFWHDRGLANVEEVGLPGWEERGWREDGKWREVRSVGNNVIVKLIGE